MKVGVLFSGGKDSCLALHMVHEQGDKISCLMSVLSKNHDSFMFHTPAIGFVKKQAKALQIPLLTTISLGEEEKEVDDLKKLIAKAVQRYKITGVVTGAVRSIYQASRIQRICNELGVACFNPLWMKDAEEHLLDILQKRMQCIVTKVSAYGFDKSWVGREIDSQFLYDIKKLHEKFGISMVGEGGEYESFVLDAPLFKRRLDIREKEVHADRHYALLEIKKMHLVKKERRRS